MANTTTSVEGGFKTITKPIDDGINFFTSTLAGQALLLIMIFLIMGVMSLSDTNNNKLGGARFAKPKEIRKAKKLGRRQIKAKIHNESCLYLGSDRRLVLPDVQRSIAVVGSSGSGKTESFTSPSIDSAIEQGWTCLVYDVKGTLMQRHAAYAASRGYDVYVFAPGIKNKAKKYISDGLNFLDFMNGPLDGGMAQEIASVLNRNLKPPGAREDGFFGSNGDALLKAMFMMARGSVYPDLLGAFELLSVPELAQRLVAATKYRSISPWIRAAATGLLSTAEAAETVSGIVGTAVTSFASLIDPTLVSCLLESTIPLDLPGKQIVFFQIDEQREAATAPLVATAMHMLITRNLNSMTKRDRPFFINADEFTSLRLISIEGQVNRLREYGAVINLIYQSDSQLRMRYSPEYAQSILNSCGTKVYFSPGLGNNSVSESISKALGQKWVKYKTKSRSSGHKAGTTTVEHYQKVPLQTAEEIEQMKSGECIILSPGYEGRPYRLRIRRLKRDLASRRNCVKLWQEKISNRLAARSVCNSLTITSLDQVLLDRAVLADAALPTSEELAALQRMNSQPAPA